MGSHLGELRQGRTALRRSGGDSDAYAGACGRASRFRKSRSPRSFPCVRERRPDYAGRPLPALEREGRPAMSAQVLRSSSTRTLGPRSDGLLLGCSTRSSQEARRLRERPPPPEKVDPHRAKSARRVPKIDLFAGDRGGGGGYGLGQSRENPSTTSPLPPDELREGLATRPAEAGRAPR